MGNIKKLIISKKSFFIGRVGGIEGEAIKKYFFNQPITEDLLGRLKQNTGFYGDNKSLNEFCRIYLESVKNTDLLYRLEFTDLDDMLKELKKEVHVWSCVKLHQWIPYLEGKRVLVVSPFVETIRKQFGKKNILSTGRIPIKYPEFKLVAVNSPNTVLGEEYPNKDWVESYRNLCKEVFKARNEFDIAIVGCGSYGMPISSFIKSMGKGSLYAGSYTQVLFGIKGKRWDIEGNITRSYWNDTWVYPSDKERPRRYLEIEGGCYW